MKLLKQTMNTLELLRQSHKQRSIEAMRKNDSSRKMTSMQMSIKDDPVITGASQLQRTKGAEFQNYMTQSEATGLSLTPTPVKNAMNDARDPTASRLKAHVKSVLDTQQLTCSVRKQQMKPGLEQVKKSIKMVQISFCCFCCKVHLIRNSVDCRGCEHKQCSECVLAATEAHALKRMRDMTKTRKCT